MIHEDSSAVAELTREESSSEICFKLTAGAKHIMKPSGNKDQDNSRLIHPTIPFAAVTDWESFLDSQKKSTMILQVLVVDPVKYMWSVFLVLVCYFASCSCFCVFECQMRCTLR